MLWNLPLWLVTNRFLSYPKSMLRVNIIMTLIAALDKQLFIDDTIFA